jgi:hypothetical protein
MALENPVATDGDAGFIGFASRLNPLQLQAGLLQSSVNMRLDRGVAQTRKGAKRLADDVDTSATAPLALDFTLGTDQTIGTGNMTHNAGTVTVTLTGHGFSTNDVINVLGATQDEYNGDFTITVTDANTFTYQITGTPAANTATGTIIVNDGPVIQSSYGSGVYAMGVFSSPNLDSAREYIVLVAGSKAYFWRDGSRPITKTYPTSADEVVEDGDEVNVLQAFDRLYIFRKAPEWGVAKEIQTLTSSSTTVTVTAVGHGIANGQSVRISNVTPSDYNGTYTATYVSPTQFTYTIPVAINTAGTGPMTVEGATEYGPKGYGVTSSTCTISNASPAVVTVSGGHGFSDDQPIRFTTTGALPTGLAINTTYYVKSSTSTTFQVSTSIGGASVNTTGAGSGTHTVVPVAALVSSTTATIHAKGHGYPVGATVRLEGSTVPAFDGIEYEILTTSTNTFTATVPSGTSSDFTVVGRTIKRVKPPMYWDGGSGNFVRASRGIPSEGVSFRRMQSVGWAEYINNRVWAPDGRDSVMISDVLDPDLFDPFFSSFRANQGSADYIVGIHPWVEGQALVFLRNSIWLATLNQFSSTDGSDFSVDSPVSSLQLLTDEVGCVARKSIATAGQYVYFLSDAGVYRLDSRLDLKLRGDTRPLSDSIADQFDGLSGDAASKAIGKWFNNRYWLSVPTGTINEPYNLYIYSALNEAWETKDIYNFPIDDLLVAIYGRERRLFAASRNGRLFLLDELETGDQSETGTTLAPVAASMRTRRYSMGTLRSKRFVRSLADAVLPHQSSMRMRAVTINPDGTLDVLSLANNSGETEDYTLKGPVRAMANYLEVELETLTGRPSFRAVSVEAALKQPAGTEARTRS